MHMQTGEPSQVLIHVGANVHRFRTAANLSQVALANRAGVSRRTIIKLESGEANISLTGLDHLADALGVTFVDLVAAPAAAHADMLVVGTRGAGGFLGLRMGSTADQVMRHAPCPVVVVPVQGDDDPDDLDTQVLATD